MPRKLTLHSLPSPEQFVFQISGPNGPIDSLENGVHPAGRCSALQGWTAASSCHLFSFLADDDDAIQQKPLLLFMRCESTAFSYILIIICYLSEDKMVKHDDPVQICNVLVKNRAQIELE